MSEAERRHAPATWRNREPIAGVLDSILPASGLVLEVASGTGEHVIYFARRFAHLIWQPTDHSPEALRSIAAWADEESLPNIRPPLELDAARGNWPITHADAVLCINMIHISPWSATVGLMRGAGRVLAPGAPLCLYGPFRRRGRPLEPSNKAFDLDLRATDDRWGVRDLDEVAACAQEHGLVLDDVVEMPANNLAVIFHKRALAPAQISSAD